MSGELHLRFNHCVDFIFQGPGIFEIEDYQNIRVTKGNIRTIVLNENGKGFTIKSPTATYIDWGTEFAVNVSPSQQDKFNIDQGKVEVSPADKPHNSTMLTRANLSQQKLDFIELDDGFEAIQPGEAGAKRNFKHLKNLPTILTRLVCTTLITLSNPNQQKNCLKEFQKGGKCGQKNIE